MKKVLLALFAFMTSISLMAEDSVIERDEVGSDGYRVISCNLINTRCSFTDKVIFNVGLFALEKDGRVSKSIMIQVYSNEPYKINGGMELLIKNRDGDVLKLKTQQGGDASVRDLVKIGNTILHHYQTLCFYNVTDEELEMLKKGITKVRQEKVLGSFEKEYKKDKHIAKITQVIIDQDKLINDALLNKKTFDSDF